MLHHHYLIPSFGPHLMDVYYLFLISNILHVFCSLLVSPCNFQTFLPISSDKTHTKLETKNFAVWRKLHSSHIGTWNHMCEFYMHYQHHPRIIFLLLIWMYLQQLAVTYWRDSLPPSFSVCLLLPMLSIWNTSSGPGAVIKWCFSAHLIVLKWQMGFDYSW